VSAATGGRLFLHYDRAGLDREYDNRAKVADSAAWVARYARQSERARAELPCQLDVPYGTAPGETLDVFPVPGTTPAPIHVFVHGGYWQRLDKSDFSFVARAFQPAGAVTVVVNYALMPAVDMDELVRQCRASIAWAYDNAEALGGDRDRLHVSGHSAGGHLVAMLMSTDWRSFAGVPPDVIKGGSGISGLYDLEPIRLSYLNDVLGLTPEAARRNSPIHLVPERAGRLLLAVGGLEGPEYHRQTDTQADAWRKRGLACEVMDMAGHHHFSIVAELEDPASALSRALLGQMGLAR
jgi:arylformamidase